MFYLQKNNIYDKIAVILVQTYLCESEVLVYWIVCFKDRYYLIQLYCNLNLKISSNKPDKLLSALLAFGVIHKERTLRFRNFRKTPSPLYVHIRFELTPLHPQRKSSLSDRDMFSELLSMKEPQTTLQNKETTVRSYRKMFNQSTSKRPGIEFVLFNCTEEMGMDNFVYLNSSFCFISNF